MASRKSSCPPPPPTSTPFTSRRGKPNHQRGRGKPNHQRRPPTPHATQYPYPLDAAAELPDLRARQAKAMQGNAVAGMLFVNPENPAAADGYALGLGVLLYSIKRQLQQFPPEFLPRFIVMVYAEGPLAPTAEQRAALVAFGWELWPVPYDSADPLKARVNRGIKPAQSHYFYTPGLKIHAFRLPFRRVVYVDADAVLTDPAEVPETLPGCPGNFAELFRVDLGARRVAAAYDAQKAWSNTQTGWWRRRWGVIAFHGARLPLDSTRFYYPGMSCYDDRSPGYRMTATGLMVLDPSDEYYGAFLEAIAAIPLPAQPYSDGDMFTHAATVARSASGGWEPGLVALDPLYYAHRGRADLHDRKPYGVHFGGANPWAPGERWPDFRSWDVACDALEALVPIAGVLRRRASGDESADGGSGSDVVDDGRGAGSGNGGGNGDESASGASAS